MYKINHVSVFGYTTLVLKEIKNYKFSLKTHKFLTLNIRSHEIRAKSDTNMYSV